MKYKTFDTEQAAIDYCTKLCREGKSAYWMKYNDWMYQVRSW